MKLNTNTTLSILLLAGLLTASSCSNESQEKAGNMADTIAAKAENTMQDIKEGAQNAAAEAKDAVNGNADSNFLVKATIANNEELQVLQAGWDNGTSKELKAHAKMMIADHKKLGAQVKVYATAKGYPIPESDNGKASDIIADLNKNAKGADWDKAWTDKVADAHKDAIDMFEKGENNVKDAELKTMIANTLPTLHSHYDMMKQMQDKMKK